MRRRWCELLRRFEEHACNCVVLVVHFAKAAHVLRFDARVLRLHVSFLSRTVGRKFDAGPTANCLDIHAEGLRDVRPCVALRSHVCDLHSSAGFVLLAVVFTHDSTPL